MTCTHCQAQTPDGITLCHNCTTQLEQILNALPDLLLEAETTMARMDRIGQTQGGNTRTREGINLEALDRVRETQTLLTSWAQMIFDITDAQGTRIRNGLSSIEVLQEHMPTIRTQDWADDMLKELSRAHRRVTACVDAPMDTVVIGKCEGVNEDGSQCAGRIIADMVLDTPDEPGGKKVPTNARCKKCHGRFDADDIMNANVERAENHWTSLNEAIQLARLVPGTPSRATLYRMAERGEFEARGADEHPLYSAAEIVKRVTEMRESKKVA